MLKPKSYDVAVIGAGVFGAWTAYQLQRAGAKVALIDAYGPGNSRASSGGESRVIRMGYGPHEIYTRSAIRSLARWQELFAAVKPPLFHRAGVLWLAPQGDPYSLATRNVLQKCGVRFENLSRAELKKRYPQMAFAQGVSGILEPESGAVMARRAVEVLVEETIRCGADYFPGAVTAPAGEGKVTSVTATDGDRFRAAEYVFACGPWLPKLFPHVLGGRIQPTRQEVFFFGVPAGDRRFLPPALPVWIDFGKEIYGLPGLEGRGLKISLDRHGTAFDPDTGDRAVRAESIRAMRRLLGRRFPALKNAPLLETRVCQYENTSNGDFLIDRHPRFDNVWLVGGGSGHGFKHGPAVGEQVATRIAGSGAAEPRFALAAKLKLPKRQVY